MIYIISYDIPEDRVRARLAKLLEGHGIRVQYSVFECDLTPAQFRKLRREIEYLIDTAVDNVRIYPICAECAPRIERIGVKGCFEGNDSCCYVL